MKKIYLMLIIAYTVVSACKKKEVNVKDETDAVAAATTGTLVGVISPAAAVKSVGVSTMVDNQNLTYQATLNNDGTFEFKALPEGNYTMNYTLTAGYEAPGNLEVNVLQGQATKLGTLTFTVSKLTGTITGTVDKPGAVIGIVAMSMSNIFARYYAALDAASGKFVIDRLPVGNYLINYVTKSSADYYAPGTSNIAVQTNQSTDIGLINIKDAVLGSISGTISPAGSVSGIIATAESTGKKYNTAADAAGNFKLSGLPYGNYFVIATPAAGSNLFAPYRKPVYVGNGQDVNMVNIGLTTTAPPYPVAFQVNGIAYQTKNGDIDAYYTPTTFGLNSALDGYRLIITLSGINGTGEYICNAKTGSRMSLSTITPPAKLDAPMIMGGNWNTSLSGSEATVKINSIDPLTKMIAGTFTAKLAATMGVNIKTITNGTFYVPYE